MATITAAQIKSENGWTDDDISNTNLEYLIDNIINYINLETGSGISNLSGGSVTVTSAQDVVIKSGVALVVRGYLDKGPNVSVGSAAITQILSDPHFSMMTLLFKSGIKRLRGRSFERT